MAIISTGDEVVDPAQTPRPGQVRDINSFALCAQAQACGFAAAQTRVLADDEELLAAEIAALMQACDVVVVSGGSSQGEKDATARVIERVASEGVLTHGLAVKPGKPTITGFDVQTQTLLVGLPGHPLSAMMVFEVLLAWLLREARGAAHPLLTPATLAHNLATAGGKDTLQLVALTQGSEDGALIATPIHSKSGLITKLTQASGYLWIDRNTEGLQTNTPVAVHRFTM
jgi:molybdopterin molybdotransferase